jgi:ankyrin repeat protein
MAAISHEYGNLDWPQLICKIGIKDVNKELDKRFNSVFGILRDIASVSTSDNYLTERINSLKATWFPARDQYERSVLHVASLNGNTRLVRCLVYSGCPINLKDGIGQTPLTLALHMGHTVTAKVLLDCGASVREQFFLDTIPPIEIAKVKKDELMIELIEQKIREEEKIINHMKSNFNKSISDESTDMETSSTSKPSNVARKLNINVGDQKNTVLVQGCANRCPDVYGCHTPGGGDFHCRGYVNECIARIAGPGGFWHVVENIMKRPTVNPSSFKSKFKDNNYNNNEEALSDYDDGLSIAMIKSFRKSPCFPDASEFDQCLKDTKSHNKILIDKFKVWVKEQEEQDAIFKYQSQVVNQLMPITRWYRESVRYVNY